MNEMNPMKKINEKLTLLEAKVDSLTSMLANPMNSEQVQQILADNTNNTMISDEQISAITSGIQNTITQQLATIIAGLTNPQGGGE